MWTIRGAIVLGVIVLVASAVDKTLWDWLQLLIVPLVLAIGGYLFNSSQNRATQAATDRRAQDDTLQAYLDGMAQLLTDKERPLHRASVGDSLSTVARARTLTVLYRLDGSRKGSVVQFLYESGLIAKNRPVLDVSGSILWNASLISANLQEANLSGADLSGADLGAANLSGANLSGAILSEVYLIGADLALANLREANLSGAALSGAALSYAILPGANLRGAGLTDANLSGAVGITNEQLEQQASSLEGATMPNGQKYEEWLKSKGRGEDGENSGTS